MIDRQRELPDGRTLGFTEIGSSGTPVAFYFHGASGGRIELATLDEAFAEIGVPVITPRVRLRNVDTATRPNHAADDEDLAVAWCEQRYGADGSRLSEGDMDLRSTECIPRE